MAETYCPACLDRWASQMPTLVAGMHPPCLARLQTLESKTPTRRGHLT